MSVLLVLALVAGQDWPEFRGPTAQGCSAAKEVPVEWGADRNVAWKRPIPGHGWSSPALSGGRLYLTTAVPIEGSKDLWLAALCLDPKSGELLWRADVFRQEGATAPPIHAKNSHASPTPVVDGGQVFVHFGLHGTACLDLEGRVAWRFKGPAFDPEDGNGNSPLLAGDRLIINFDGKDLTFLVALDRATGRQLWKTDRKTTARNRYSYSTPLLIEVGGRKQVISPGSGVVGAFDPKTGGEVWRVGYGEGYSVVPRPVSGHGLVYVCTGFDKPRLLAIRPDGTGDVTRTHVAWSSDRAVPLIASLLLDGDELYMVSDTGVAGCLDAKTGEELWRERIGAQHWASPVLAERRIYFVDVTGAGTVLKAGRAFEVIARNELGERTFASPAPVDGALFIRTEKHLYRIGGR